MIKVNHSNFQLTYKSLSLSVFVILCLALFHNNLIAQSKNSLNKSLDSLLKKEKLTGVVWSIVSENGEIEVGATGYKNNKTKELLSPNDKVHVGSVSKTVLAAGMLRLVTLGLIQLDDPVKKYLPELKFDNVWEIDQSITIRHLLDHTAGLADVKLWFVFSTSATPNTPLNYVFCKSPDILHIHTKPGKIYSYSNVGYTILGMIIEKISNKRYEVFLNEQLLRPLGMDNSTFLFVSQAGNYIDKQLAFGHLDNGEPVITTPGYLRPAGQFTTTAKDMGVFLRFMMSTGEVNNSVFIRSDLLKLVGEQMYTDAFLHGVSSGDALGAYTRDRYGVVGVAKNGNTLGFSSMIYMFPKNKKAFFITHNTDSETAEYDLFNQLLVKHLNIPKQNFLKTKRLTEKHLQQWNGFYIPVITKVQPFNLIDKLFSHTQVIVTDSGAFLKPFQGKSRELIYKGQNTFSMADRINNSHAFYKNENEELIITDGIRTIRKINKAEIVLPFVSILIGIFGIIYIIVRTLIKLCKENLQYQPCYLVIISLLIILISVLILVKQPFIRLGEKTLGSYCLAVGTSLLPIFSLVSSIQIVRADKSYLKSLCFWATVSIVQLCILLAINNLLPLILWH